MDSPQLSGKASPMTVKPPARKSCIHIEVPERFGPVTTIIACPFADRSRPTEPPT